MNSSLSKLRKLKGRSLNELRARGAQRFSAYAEQIGWSEQSRIPSDASLFKRIDQKKIARQNLSPEGLLEHFRTRGAPHFFPAFADSKTTVAELKRRWPEAERRIIERADRITDGSFDLLGFSDLRFGSPIEWHLEPLSGKRSPLVHWSALEEISSGETGDKKIVWELNRHQHFTALGRAYWLTGDERYAQTFVKHLVGWMDGNPPKLGVNWISSLEVAFRSISWLWAFFFFKDSAEIKPAIFLRWLKFLYLNARHLETYLSLYSSPNTHLTGEALGLFYIGMLLPELHDAARWRTTAKKILLAELNRHVRPDGVYFEQTSYYHRYTTDFYLHLHALLKANGEHVESGIEEKLILLLDHLMSITRPDGTTPFFGDDDGGKLMMLDENRAANDFRATLSTGASLFARPDYKYVADEAAEETLWLLGIGGIENFDRLKPVVPAYQSRAFADGGYYVMRDGWTREANYMLIDCGPHGALNCGHAHADALSFDMAARGRTLLVDPGTYTYTGSREMRDRFRSSAAHNTLTVDRIESSEPNGPFSWKQIAEAQARQWISHHRFDYFEGEHNGYARLAAPVTHVRSVLFLKNDYWIIHDRAETVGAHRYDLHYHFTPDAAPMIDGSSTVATAREIHTEAPGLEMFTFGSGGRGEWHKENGDFSPRYGERFDAPTLVFTAEGEGAQDFYTFLIPRDSQSPDSPVSQAREIKSTDGRAFEISYGESRDVLHIGEGRVADVTGATDAKLRLASDFDWAWARFSTDTGTLEQLVLIGGSQFSINGCEIMNAKDRIEYAVARRVGQELMVETPASEKRRVIFQMDVSGVLTEEIEAIK